MPRLQGFVDEPHTFKKHASGRLMLLPVHVWNAWPGGSSLQEQLHMFKVKLAHGSPAHIKSCACCGQCRHAVRATCHQGVFRVHILWRPGLAAALQVVNQFDELVEDTSPHRDALLKVFLRKIKRVKHREAGQLC